jgi:hypothetical protein
VSHVPKVLAYGKEYSLNLNLNYPLSSHVTDAPIIQVALLRPGFSTHSMHMSQRYVILNHFLEDDMQTLKVEAPSHSAIFPPGPAILHVLRSGVPAEGTYLHVAEYEDDQPSDIFILACFFLVA